MAAPATSLQQSLSASLPERLSCRYHYIHSQPRPCEPLFSPVPGQDPTPTRLSNHFLAISLVDKDRPIFVLGLEIAIYTTRHLTTVFVGKADSTGYDSADAKLPIGAVCSAFLSWLVHQQIAKRPSRKLVVSLFARSQTQYLFPGSAENPGKHILDDRGLIKWWARVLDVGFRNPLNQPTQFIPSFRGYMTIPGYSPPELRFYFPAQANLQWIAGDPLIDLAVACRVPRDAPPRCLLPRFLDDPKARFIADLDEEVGLAEQTHLSQSPGKKRTNAWRTIHDLDRFWEAMEFRQECSSGRVVGFIWIVCTSTSGTTSPPRRSKITKTFDGESAAKQDPSSQKKPRRCLTGPIHPRLPRLKGFGPSALSKHSSTMTSIGAACHDHGVSVSKEGYGALMQTLLHLDFATRDVAVQSTKKWIEEAASACGLAQGWGTAVTGTYRAGPVSSDVHSYTTNTVTPINSLDGMVRKNRKPEFDNSVAAQVKESEGYASINQLSTDLVRKRPKTSGPTNKNVVQ